MDPYYSRVEEIFRVTGRKEGWPEFPDGNFVEPNYGPDSGTIQRLTELGKQRGMKFSKIGPRRTERARKLGQSASAGRDGDGQAGNGFQRHRARGSPRIRTPAWSTERTSSTAIRAANVTSRRGRWSWPRAAWRARGCC